MSAWIRILEVSGLLCSLAAGVVIFRTIRAKMRESTGSDDRERERQIVPRGMPWIFGFTMAALLAHAGAGEVARGVVRKAVAPSTDPVVFLAGSRPVNQQVWIDALRSLHYVLDHHSHATGRMRVSVHSLAGDLELEVARDSELADEYWVFILGSSLSTSRLAGRFHATNLLGSP